MIASDDREVFATKPNFNRDNGLLDGSFDSKNIFNFLLMGYQLKHCNISLTTNGEAP